MKDSRECVYVYICILQWFVRNPVVLFGMFSLLFFSFISHNLRCIFTEVKITIFHGPPPMKESNSHIHIRVLKRFSMGLVGTKVFGLISIRISIWFHAIYTWEVSENVYSPSPYRIASIILSYINLADVSHRSICQHKNTHCPVIYTLRRSIRRGVLLTAFFSGASLAGSCIIWYTLELKWWLQLVIALPEWGSTFTHLPCNRWNKVTVWTSAKT